MSRAALALQLGSGAIRLVPARAVGAVGAGLGTIVAKLDPSRTEGLTANLARVLPEADHDQLQAIAEAGIGSYGRYWAETMRLPTITTEQIDRGFDVDGFEHIQASIAGGHGPVMVLPHLGGWEWAAAWLGRVAEMPVSAVVERLEPDDVYRWFHRVRTSYGVRVIPLGPDALGAVIRRVKAGDVVCLLADRDLAGSGVEVTFFGEQVSFPVGPALVARRTGAPLLPTAVYFEGRRRRCCIRPPVIVADTGHLRADLQTTTQSIATALEELIAAAPSQWHVLEPIFDRPVGEDLTTGH